MNSMLAPSPGVLPRVLNPAFQDSAPKTHFNCPFSYHFPYLAQMPDTMPVALLPPVKVSRLHCYLCCLCSPFHQPWDSANPMAGDTAPNFHLSICFLRPFWYSLSQVGFLSKRLEDRARQVGGSLRVLLGSIPVGGVKSKEAGLGRGRIWL